MEEAKKAEEAKKVEDAKKAEQAKKAAAPAPAKKADGKRRGPLPLWLAGKTSRRIALPPCPKPAAVPARRCPPGACMRRPVRCLLPWRGRPLRVAEFLVLGGFAGLALAATKYERESKQALAAAGAALKSARSLLPK